MNVICLEFAEIFSSLYGIPFPPFLISSLAKIWFRKLCFSFVFSCVLLCVLQFVCCYLCCLCVSPRFWSCPPLCCATRAVVCVTFAPPVRLYLVFPLGCSCVCVVFFEVAVYFLLLLLLLSPVLSVLLWCSLVAGVSSWSRGLLGVSCVCGGWLVCVVCVFWFFCLCWFWCVLGCPLFWWLLWLLRCCVARAVGLLVGCGGCVALSAFCSWWCCSAVVLLLVWFWFVVAPVLFMLLLVRVLLFWWFWW